MLCGLLDDEMIVYDIVRRKGEQEEYIPHDDDRPYVIIEQESSNSKEIVFVFERARYQDPDDGCYTVYNALVSPALTTETAQLVLAAINNVDVSEIRIIQRRGICAV